MYPPAYRPLRLLEQAARDRGNAERRWRSAIRDAIAANAPIEHVATLAGLTIEGVLAATRPAGKDVADAFGPAYARSTPRMSRSVWRDQDTALDRALDPLGADADHTDLWPDAEATRPHEPELDLRDGVHSVTPSIAAAVHMYWLGHWDGAMAQLSTVNEAFAKATDAGAHERGPALVWHGVAALIAARRDDRRSAADSLSAGLALPILTAADRENSTFLIAAHALVAEQDGDPYRALSILSTFLPRRLEEVTLVQQWLPDIVRLALAVGDRAAAETALLTCQAEAAAESSPSIADAVGSRCAGLVNGDLAALHRAVGHYRATGAAVELARALEDLAVVLADSGNADEARNVLNQAVDLYDGFGAAWDIGQADRRLRALGVRRGVHGPRPKRAALGWEALTPTELKVAHHVGQGMSTPKIAERMLLSRRTVQTHISHILNKLGACSRVDIAREVFRRGRCEEVSEEHCHAADGGRRWPINLPDRHCLGPTPLEG